MKECNDSLGTDESTISCICHTRLLSRACAAQLCLANILVRSSESEPIQKLFRQEVETPPNMFKFLIASASGCLLRNSKRGGNRGFPADVSSLTFRSTLHRKNPAVTRSLYHAQRPPIKILSSASDPSQSRSKILSNFTRPNPVIGRQVNHLQVGPEYPPPARA